MSTEFIQNNWLFIFFAIMILGGLSAIFKIQFRWGKGGLTVGASGGMDERYLDLVVTASLNAGYEISTIRNVETVDSQIAMAKDKLYGLREIFLESYNTDAAVWQVLDCTYHIFCDEILNNLRNIFIRENSKSAKGQTWDILSILELKEKAFASEWRRVCMLYFPSNLMKNDYSSITELIENRKVSDKFHAELHDVLVTAQSIAVENEERIRTVKKELKEYVRRIGDKKD